MYSARTDSLKGRFGHGAPDGVPAGEACAVPAP